MIATHNIKVNGQWIHAGEEYEPATVVAAAPAVEEKAPEPVKAEEPEAEKAEAKPRTTRRKKISE